MRGSVCLLLAVLASAMSLYAEDLGKATKKSGLLCNSMCVKQSAGYAACDQTCTDKTGDVVLVDDQGQVFNIANQDKVTSHTGKKVKVKCRPVKDKKDTMYIDSMYLGG